MQFFVKLFNVFQEVRWHQWYKGFFTFFALLWVSHQSVTVVSLVFAGAVAFNFVSSIVYIINDFKDIDFDRAHPIKMKRPIAAGSLSNLEAYGILVLLAGVVMILVSVLNNVAFAAIILTYVLLNLLYTYGVKHIPYLDIFFIACFAGMRVVAGFVLLGLPIAWYFVSVIVTLFLFVMTVQRLAEISVANILARPVIAKYSPRVLKFFMTLFLMITVIMYFIALSFVALPLVYTDSLYFLVLFSVYEYMAFTETKKRIAEDGFIFLLHDKRTLTMVVLFVLSLVVLGIWYIVR